MRFCRTVFISLLMIGGSVASFPELALSNVQLPRLVSDGMVLQRQTDVNIWGWAAAGEEISVQFQEKTYRTIANNKGEWTILLPPLEAGGPHTMEISGSNRVVLDDIFVGEVWISSGQSNMELPMHRVEPLYGQEIADSEGKQIHYFNVPDRYNFRQPQQKLDSGSWIKASPRTVRDFSAVAYFFAAELYEKYQVPIGIINASAGGTPVQAWISEEALQNTFPEYYREAQRFKDSTLISRIERKDEDRFDRWYTQLNQKDRGQQATVPWYEPEIPATNWQAMTVPGYWTETDLGDINGVVWFRKTISLPAKMSGREARLNLGRIIDADSVFINGNFVGSTSYKYPPRRYDVPAGVLKEGDNTIAIRLINVRGRGGFVPDKPYHLAVGDTLIDLKGPWKYRLGGRMEPLEPQTFISWKPVGLFNAMIAPLMKYRMKGVIWYQGESNTEEPEEYEALFSLMIRNWRDQWNQGDFPFLFVQLANFRKAGDTPTESNWAALREAQRSTLSLPNTGMAVTIDLGEWNDIHPLNKKDVGKRLALSASKVAYGEDDLVFSGPLFESISVDDQKIVLSFSQAGNGLMAKDDTTLKGFTVAGEDSNFVRARAEIIAPQKVVVWSDKIKNPVAVRYAWADNPARANLYNRKGLPASPFEADQYPDP